MRPNIDHNLILIAYSSCVLFIVFVALPYNGDGMSNTCMKTSDGRNTAPQITIGRPYNTIYIWPNYWESYVCQVQYRGQIVS